MRDGPRGRILSNNWGGGYSDTRLNEDYAMREIEAGAKLGVTAEIRPGYFGLPDIGTLFVENRYAKHCSWWPHQTLRNLWSLAHVVDPVRLRMEFLDPKQHADRYAERFPGSPLRPELWTGDAVFATVMLSSPLCWTGFVTSAADGKGGYALIFRECAKESSFTLDLAPYVSASSAEKLAGSGTARMEGLSLRVEIPEKLGYLWLALNKEERYGSDR